LQQGNYGTDGWAPPVRSATVDLEATDGPFFDMTTKDIRTSHAHTVCDVCGRTLLRGERAETYINGDARRSVCELCKSRALNEGWVREGTLPGFDSAGSGSERRLSLLNRLRRRDSSRRRGRPTLDDELAGRSWQPPTPEPSAPAWTSPPPFRASVDPAEAYENPDEEAWADPLDGATQAYTPIDLDEPLEEIRDEPPAELPPSPQDEPRARRPWSRRPRSHDAQEDAAPRPPRQARPDPQPAPPAERRALAREPRHVRAVPSSDDQKMAAAVAVFNQSEHRRTVVGVARSLGGASVTVMPAPEPPSLVRIVVCWELCWYRYAVDLSDEVPGVRVDGQGYELDELSEVERAANAVADESGQLILR
jgi:hypothetical protein